MTGRLAQLGECPSVGSGGPGFDPRSPGPRTRLPSWANRGWGGLSRVTGSPAGGAGASHKMGMNRARAEGEKKIVSFVWRLQTEFRGNIHSIFYRRCLQNGYLSKKLLAMMKVCHFLSVSCLILYQNIEHALHTVSAKNRRYYLTEHIHQVTAGDRHREGRMQQRVQSQHELVCPPSPRL